MLALMEASIAIEAVAISGSRPVMAIARFAAITTSTASNMRSFSIAPALISARIRLSPNHSAACPVARYSVMVALRSVGDSAMRPLCLLTYQILNGSCQSLERGDILQEEH